MIVLVTLVFASVFAVLCWQTPQRAIALLLFLLPTYLIRFSILGVPVTFLEIGILVLFGVFLLQQCIAHKPFYRLSSQQRFIVYGVLLCLIAGIFGVLTTPDMRAGAGLFKAYIIEPILFFIVFISTIKTQKDLDRVGTALILSGVIVALTAIFQYVTGYGIPDPWHDFPGRRATAFYAYPNAVGLYLAPILLLTLSRLFWEKSSTHAVWFRRWFIVVSSILLFLALCAARVEGAIVAVLAGSIFLLLWTRWRWHAIIASATGLCALLLYEPTRRILFFQDVSGDVRLALWEGTLNLLRAQPMFGSGLAGFPSTYDLYRLPSHVELLLYPHNIFLDFWTQLGIVGLLWLIAVLVSFFFVLTKSDGAIRHYRLLLMGVMVSILVYGIVDVPYFKNDLSVLFWTWLGMAVVIRNFRSGNTLPQNN